MCVREREHYSICSHACTIAIHPMNSHVVCNAISHLALNPLNYVIDPILVYVCFFSSFISLCGNKSACIITVEGKGISEKAIARSYKNAKNAAAVKVLQKLKN